MIISLTNQSGQAVPVFTVFGSAVISAVASSQSVVIPPACYAIMISSAVDIWVRIGAGTPEADGANGCVLIPGGVIQTFGISNNDPSNPVDINGNPAPVMRAAVATLSGVGAVSVAFLASKSEAPRTAWVAGKLIQVG